MNRASSSLSKIALMLAGTPHLFHISYTGFQSPGPRPVQLEDPAFVCLFVCLFFLFPEFLKNKALMVTDPRECLNPLENALAHLIFQLVIIFKVS